MFTISEYHYYVIHLPSGGDQMVDVKPFANGASTIEPDTATDQTADSLVLSTQAASQILNPGTLLRQINQLGPSERCSPTQAQNMGKQLLTIIAYHEKNNVSLPGVCVCVCVCVCRSSEKVRLRCMYVCVCLLLCMSNCTVYCLVYPTCNKGMLSCLSEGVCDCGCMLYL